MDSLTNALISSFDNEWLLLVSIKWKDYSDLKSKRDFPSNIALSSSLSIAPKRTSFVDILFNPNYFELRSIILGIKIPSKHPIVIPTDSAQIGPESISVTWEIINPQKVPKKDPKKSLNVFP